MTKKKKVLEFVTGYYLTSRDFNGTPTPEICSSLGVSSEELKRILITLTKEGVVSLVSEAVDVNVHIKRFPALPQAEQVRLLEEMEHLDRYSSSTCIYPSASHLRGVVDDQYYKDRPFTLEIALGAPQLSHRSFDPSVLEFYREDPRYHFFYDIRGEIVIKAEFYGSNRVPSFDEIVLENFGSSLDSEGNRAVAVFLRYLSQLTPEHQQIWKTRELSGDYTLHPCYYKWMVRGEWFDCTSVFSAFSAQLKCINQVCELMGRSHLFKNDLSGDARPREFGFLVRPTSKEFNSFVHLLDKVISENINLAFFQNEIELNEEIRKRDGRVEVRPKGSIAVLAEWLQKNFHTTDEDFEASIKAIFATFKKIRKMRQKPAHATRENIFDKAYFKEQIEVMRETYEAISILRNAFCLHPVAINKNIPLAYSGRVVFQ
jgi:hypothetical protein